MKQRGLSDLSSIDGTFDDARRAAIEDAVRREGGKGIWRSSETAGCAYALLELPDRYDREAIRAVSGAVAYDGPIIALAVFPALAEALPPLLEALGGPGRPAGVLGSRTVPRGCDRRMGSRTLPRPELSWDSSTSSCAGSAADALQSCFLRCRPHSRRRSRRAACGRRRSSRSGFWS